MACGCRKRRIAAPKVKVPNRVKPPVQSKYIGHRTKYTK